MRICFIGDELVAGVGEPRGLGWVGRVNAHSTFDVPATFLTLAVPSETTKQMAARWEAEVLPRLADGEPHGLVIGIGPGDVPAGISTARSRLNLANITDRATSLGIPSFVVGPPPLAGVDWPPPAPRCAGAAGSPSSTATHPWSPTTSGSRTWPPPWLAAKTARPCPARPDTRSWRGSSSIRDGTSGRAQPRPTSEHRRTQLSLS